MYPSELRARMIDQLKGRGLAMAPAIEEAFRGVPREVFLPGIPIERVYSGDAIITRSDEQGRPISSSSEVGIMIAMAQLLDVAPGQRILEIGAGTGYNAAVLSRHVPAGMLFVPSKRGISHSPAEDTSDEHLVLGARALLRAVQALAI